MKNRSRILYAVLLTAVLVAALLGGCAPSGRGGAAQSPDTGQGGKLRVVTTLFPYYDFTRQVAGDSVELSLVIPAGMDSHSFEPTPADMRTIQNADILICNGGAMEHWLEQVLGAAGRPDMTVVTMMDYVDAFEEELVEGMEHMHADGGRAGHSDAEPGDDGHAEPEDYVDHDGHDFEIEYDEHIWTSPVNAMKMVDVICETLCEAQPQEAAAYRAAADACLAELADIDKGLREVSDQRRRNMIVVADKFPFRYLAEEYALDYRAAFSGCSSDTEPSAKTIAYLIDKINEQGIPVVYYLELSSHRVAEIISEETGARPLLLHSCHNVTRTEFERGITYAELMRGNIEALREGLDE